MTKYRSRPADFPANSLERIQAFEDKIVLGWTFDALAKIIYDADSTAFQRLRWHRVNRLVDENGADTSLPIAEADPDAKKYYDLIQSRKKKVTVVTAGSAVMRKITSRSFHYSPGVAFTLKDQTWAALLDRAPDYDRFAHETNKIDLTAAFRTGSDNFGIGVGGFYPWIREFIAPTGNNILAQNLPLQDIVSEFPGTPVV